VVERAARTVSPPVVHTDEYRYFVTRYLVLSGLKDAVKGDYDATERLERARRLRARLRVGDLAVLARRRDVRRLALATSARVSVRAYRLVLAVADR
jgi:hypothetical protein